MTSPDSSAVTVYLVWGVIVFLVWCAWTFLFPRKKTLFVDVENYLFYLLALALVALAIYLIFNN